MSQPPAPTPAFGPKHRWEFKNNAISGICLLAWLELLWTRRRHVDWASYWQRVAFLTLLAAVNSCLGLVEIALHGRAIARQPINPRPLFVLGHPRTGTTMLHQLLALDTETFGTCSTFCAGFPAAFLWVERFKWAFAGLVDKTRPMDNVDLSLDSPQEDEIATNVLSAGTSPYMPLAFMVDEPSFRPYFSFKQAPPSAKARWSDAFLYFLRKLSLRAGGRRLVLKSPAHTARVALLRSLFPEAQFVYIHRDPLTVYQSAVHMARTTYWYMYLAAPSDEQIHEFILHQFEVLWAEYKADRAALPEGSLHELSYDDLTADPVGAVGAIYQSLGLDDFDARVRPRIEATLGGQLRGYKKNTHAALDPAVRALIARRWADYIEAWGYTV